jgi:hypothetical protein
MRCDAMSSFRSKYFSCTCLFSSYFCLGLVGGIFFARIHCLISLAQDQFLDLSDPVIDSG